MSEKPWLSIIVPAYNAEGFLEACIESMGLETNFDMQVIIVDDGSTDETPSICDTIASRHENVIAVHKENGGLPSARNAGCMHANGDWLWFVDSDDMIAPYAIDSLRIAADGTDSDAIQIQFIAFSDDSELSWPTLSPSAKPTTVTIEEYLGGLYKGTYQHYVCSFLLRANSLLGTNEATSRAFREDFSLYEDVVTIEEYIRTCSSIDVYPIKAYAYRQTPLSMTHKKSNETADSGLRAVLDLQRYEVAKELLDDKLRMEISLLFSAYKLVEHGSASACLKTQIVDEIESRVHALGLRFLGFSRLIRYVLLKSGLLDLIIAWRSYRAR